MNPTEYSQKTKIKKRFLIASIDESIVNRPLFVVLAQDGAAALQIFLRRIVSREPVFRAWVMNLGYLCPSPRKGKNFSDLSSVT